MANGQEPCAEGVFTHLNAEDAVLQLIGHSILPLPRDVFLEVRAIIFTFWILDYNYLLPLSTSCTLQPVALKVYPNMLRGLKLVVDFGQLI